MGWSRTVHCKAFTQISSSRICCCRVFGLEFGIAEPFCPEFAVAGWVGLELSIARPSQRYLTLEFAVAGCLV